MNIICNDEYELGKFNINSSRIKFSDPCYKNDTWCSGDLTALNGTWDSKIGLFRCETDERELLLSIFTGELIKIGYEKFKDNIIDFSSMILSISSHKQRIIKIDDFNQFNLNDKQKEYIMFLYDSFKEKYDSNETYSEKDTWVIGKISYLLHIAADISLFNIMLIHDVIKNDNLSQESKSKTIESTAARIKLSIDNYITDNKEAFDSGKPKRTLHLQIKHSSVKEYTPFNSSEWEHVNDFCIGVDSGQAGFFDHDWYSKYSMMHEDDWESTYSMLCGLSSNNESYRHANNPDKKDGGSFEYGCVSYTAYGDGSAPLYVIKDKDGNVIEAAYFYRKDEEDE